MENYTVFARQKKRASGVPDCRVDESDKRSQKGIQDREVDLKAQRNSQRKAEAKCEGGS